MSAFTHTYSTFSCLKDTLQNVIMTSEYLLGNGESTCPSPQPPLCTAWSQYSSKQFEESTFINKTSVWYQYVHNQKLPANQSHAFGCLAVKRVKHNDNWKNCSCSQFVTDVSKSFQIMPASSEAYSSPSCYENTLHKCYWNFQPTDRHNCHLEPWYRVPQRFTLVYSHFPAHVAHNAYWLSLLCSTLYNVGQTN